MNKLLSVMSLFLLGLSLLTGCSTTCQSKVDHAATPKANGQPGNYLIFLKSGAVITLPGVNDFRDSGMNQIVSAFENQTQSGDNKTFVLTTVDHANNGKLPSSVAIRIADISAITFVVQ